MELEVNEDDVEGHWMKNGVEIKFQVETRFTYTTIRRLHRLTISETFKSDAGEYTFLAGRNQISMNLLVQRKCSSRSSLMLCFNFQPAVYSVDKHNVQHCSLLNKQNNDIHVSMLPDEVSSQCHEQTLGLCDSLQKPQGPTRGYFNHPTALLHHKL